MRALNKMEMSIAAGGVGPTPSHEWISRPPIPELDPYWVYRILPELYPPTILELNP